MGEPQKVSNGQNKKKMRSRFLLYLIVMGLAYTTTIFLILWFPQTHTFTGTENSLLNNTKISIGLNDSNSNNMFQQRVIHLENTNNDHLSPRYQIFDTTLPESTQILSAKLFPNNNPQVMVIGINFSQIAKLEGRTYHGQIELYKDNSTFLDKLFIDIIPQDIVTKSISISPTFLEISSDQNGIVSKRLKILVKEQIQNMSVSLEGSNEFRSMMKVNPVNFKNLEKLYPGEEYILYVTTNAKSSSVKNAMKIGSFEGNVKVSYTKNPQGVFENFLIPIDLVTNKTKEISIPSGKQSRNN